MNTTTRATTRRITTLVAAAATSVLLAAGLGTTAYADPTADPTTASTTTTAGTAKTSATIHLTYAGEESDVEVTDPATVADAIDELGLAVDGDDRVTPARGTAVTDGMSLVVDVVEVSTTTEHQTVAYKTIKKKTKSLMKGHRKTVRKGRTGKVTVTTTTTSVNGVATTEVTTIVDRKVRDRVVKVGTSKLNLARWKQWNRIARCESGGRWHLNTHNGYYGGLQFSLATWRSAGGSKFAKHPNRASKREQVHVANTLYAKRGFKPWSCKP